MLTPCTFLHSLGYHLYKLEKRWIHMPCIETMGVQRCEWCWGGAWFLFLEKKPTNQIMYCLAQVVYLYILLLCITCIHPEVCTYQYIVHLHVYILYVMISQIDYWTHTSPVRHPLYTYSWQTAQEHSVCVFCPRQLPTLFIFSFIPTDWYHRFILPERRRSGVFIFIPRINGNIPQKFRQPSK